MLLEANAKINIGLLVGNKRPDGYHDIETIIARISLSDSIEAKISEASETSVTIKGNERYIGEGTDLMEKAALCFSSWTGIRFSLDIAIDKRIPVEAGLGGGSSDASAILNALNESFSFPINKDALVKKSVEIGSDVPFFVSGYSGALVTGKGEAVAETAVPHGSPLYLFLPKERISTGNAYGKLDAIKRPERHLPSLSSSFPSRITHPNDFELLYNGSVPFSEEAMEKCYISLSGSGSSWFLLPTPEHVCAVENFPDYAILSEYFVI